MGCVWQPSMSTGPRIRAVETQSACRPARASSTRIAWTGGRGWEMKRPQLGTDMGLGNHLAREVTVDHPAVCLPPITAGRRCPRGGDPRTNGGAPRVRPGDRARLCAPPARIRRGTPRPDRGCVLLASSAGPPQEERVRPGHFLVALLVAVQGVRRLPGSRSRSLEAISHQGAEVRCDRNTPLASTGAILHATPVGEACL